jgi:hypothetical protein
LNQVISYGQQRGCECMEWPAKSMLAMSFIARGRLTRGFNILSSMDSKVIDSETRLSHAFNEFCYGMVYAQLACPTGPVSISFLMKNLGFILWHSPFATRKAILHYDKAIRICRDCGYNNWLGMLHLELGRLYHKKGKPEPARENLSAAIEICGECGDTTSLAQAETLFQSLEDR